jgi:hypothetical protein
LIPDYLIGIAAILSALAALGTLLANRRLQTIHLQINSRMDKLIETTMALGTAEGREKERTGNGHESG